MGYSCERRNAYKFLASRALDAHLLKLRLKRSLSVFASLVILLHFLVQRPDEDG